MITAKQYKLFTFTQKTTPCPTYTEMGDYMGVNQTSSYNMVGRLVDAGFLTRTGSPRSVKVVVE